MRSSNKRRVLGVIAAVLATQMLSACVVVPVPMYRSRAVVIEPTYGYPAAPRNHDPYWRR